MVDDGKTSLVKFMTFLVGVIQATATLCNIRPRALSKRKFDHVYSCWIRKSHKEDSTTTMTDDDLFDAKEN
jgi:hypothetical protein